MQCQPDPLCPFHCSDVGLWRGGTLDPELFPTFIFLEAFGTVFLRGPSLEIVAGGCEHLWLQYSRLGGPAALPEGKAFPGTAGHQPGEVGESVWGQGCPLNGMGDQSYHSLVYFDLGLGKMGAGDL